MTCPQCHAPVPDGQLGCLMCLWTRNRAALCERQVAPLRRVAAGELALAARIADGIWHIRMYGADQAFCGLAITGHHRRAKAIEWDDEDALVRTCPSCRHFIEELMRQKV